MVSFKHVSEAQRAKTLKYKKKAKHFVQFRSKLICVVQSSFLPRWSSYESSDLFCDPLGTTALKDAAPPTQTFQNKSISQAAIQTA